MSSKSVTFKPGRVCICELEVRNKFIRSDTRQKVFRISCQYFGLLDLFQHCELEADDCGEFDLLIEILTDLENRRTKLRDVLLWLSALHRSGIR